MGNAPLLGADSSMTTFNIGAISFFGLGTSASVIITGANTSLDVYYLANQLTIGTLSNAGAVINNPHQQTFPGGNRVTQLKVPTLVAGTAYLYLL